ncbi:MAG: hypothetical protein RI935_391 [Candidatus Parcubacteria bacterium]|jgi:four helix bundle protein
MKSYKELIVWQKSIDLVEKIYLVTSSFPQTELFGLTSQMRRSVISIPSNIAEGFSRKHTKEYVQFLRIAYASLSELETQVVITKRLGFVKEENLLQHELLIEEIAKMLNKLIATLINKE